MNIQNPEFDLIRTIVARHSGIQLGPDKNYLIESRLRPIIKEAGLNTFTEFYFLLKSDKQGNWVSRVIDVMTTHETFWFRDIRVWDLIRDKLIPDFCNQVKNKKKNKIRIWSAGCSTGQEPYSIAMLIDKAVLGYQDVSINNFEILATDISEEVINFSLKGEYSEMEIMRGLQDNYRTRCFIKKNNSYCITDKIKNMVQFKVFNLQCSFANLGKFDLILCRNVAIYFFDDFKKDLFVRFSKSLNSDGMFVLGSAESLINYNNHFKMAEYKGTIYYKI